MLQKIVSSTPRSKPAARRVSATLGNVKQTWSDLGVANPSTGHTLRRAAGSPAGAGLWRRSVVRRRPSCRRSRPGTAARPCGRRRCSAPRPQLASAPPEVLGSGVGGQAGAGGGTGGGRVADLKLQGGGQVGGVDDPGPDGCQQRSIDSPAEDAVQRAAAEHVESGPQAVPVAVLAAGFGQVAEGVPVQQRGGSRTYCPVMALSGACRALGHRGRGTWQTKTTGAR
jgi:hypothetical protein